MADCWCQIDVQEDDFDLSREYAVLRQQAGNVGAIATFTGLVREFYGESATTGVEQQGERVYSLTLEHYPGMTEKALRDIVEQAVTRWPLQACRVIHRVGTLHAGDQIVLVGVASAHRGAAFAAAEFIMDYLKTSAPFWKKQQGPEGDSWVESRDSDAEAAARWMR